MKITLPLLALYAALATAVLGWTAYENRKLKYPDITDAVLDTSHSYRVALGSSPVTGPSDAPVTMILFIDFQCDYSNKGLAATKRLMREYPGQIRMAIKHHPLSKHADAPRAALASMAASNQGKFWEMTDWLFANADDLGEQAVFAGAESLGLDMPRFTQDMDMAKWSDHFREDDRAAETIGVYSTPTILVNGIKVETSFYKPLRKAVEIALGES